MAATTESGVKPRLPAGGTRLPMKATSSPLPPGATPQGAGGAVKQRRRVRLFVQLTVCFLVMTMLPQFIVSTFANKYARSAILEDAKETLQALVQRQGREVSAYFKFKQAVIGLFSTSPLVREALAKLGNFTPAEAAQGLQNPLAREFDTEWGERMQQFVTLMDLSGLYIVSPQGVVIASVGPQREAAIDLKAADTANLALAKVFTEALATKSIVNSGLTNATGDRKAAYFLAMPVYPDEHSTTPAGVFVLSLNMTAVQEVLDNHDGLGESGESLVFTHEGGKMILLNQPHESGLTPFQPFTPLSGVEDFHEGITTPGVAEVAQGVDPSGVEVLASWTYLPHLKWTLMQKIDIASVLEPLERFISLVRIVSIITLALVLGVAAAIARSITRPVEMLTSIAGQIAQGDLTAEVRVRAKNEIGELAQAVGVMAHSLKSLVGKVQESAAVISTNAAQMAASSRQQAEVAQNTGASAVEVAAAAKQISATSQELTRTMEEVNGVAQGTAQRAESGLDGLQAIQATMLDLNKARGDVDAQLQVIAKRAEAICGITVTMTKVADQTNLLSLNAAIEARKAGDFGRGFSVVAREIQRLADQTGVATLEIERAVTEMFDAVESGVKGMSGFSAKAEAGVERVQAVAQQLTEVIQQVQGLPARFEMVLQGMQSQSEGAGQINEAISQMSGSAQQTAAAVQEALRLLEQLRETTRALQGEISLFKV